MCHNATELTDEIVDVAVVVVPVFEELRAVRAIRPMPDKSPKLAQDPKIHQPHLINGAIL